MYLRIKNKVSEFFKESSGAKSWVYNWENCGGVDSGDFKNLGKFSKINFFVGANNCGKSRFLRGLIKTEMNNLEIYSKTNIDSILDNINLKFSRIFKNPNDFKIDIEKNKKIKILIAGRNKYSDLTNNYGNFKSLFLELREELFTVEKQLLKSYIPKYALSSYENKKELFQELIKLDDEINFVLENQPEGRKYIPILRSLQKNPHLKEESFKETVKKQFEIEKDVYTGLDQYDINLKIKNSKNREKIARFESFLSKHFFNGKTIEITSDIESKDLLFAIDGVDLPIYDIGDGIQALIILLFPIYTANSNDWFFIEEPETHLHPGLQRLFIETLLSDEYLNSKNLRYFFTTHSNHFLDMTLSSNDISIFQFQKHDDAKFVIKNNIKPDNEILELLGVNTSSVFLANTSIWVEGPTDRKYISKMLRLYAESKQQSHLKEDIDFAFFEYGGNLITHYLFEEGVEVDEIEVKEKINSFALSNKIYLLADNDNAKEGSTKCKRRTVLEGISHEKDNFFYQNTIVTEIENLLPLVVIRNFMKLLVIGENNICKVDRFKFKRTDYLHIGIGEFCYDLLVSKNIAKKNIKNFRSSTGTLKNDYKLKLARLFVNSSYSYEEVIEDNTQLKEIIESLYDFIKK